MAFDFDIVQICYNGHRVLSTWVAIQTLSTGTFVSYCLSVDINNLAHTALRLPKYIRREFTFFYPQQFLALPVGSCNMTNRTHYSWIIDQFDKNNDYFRIQKTFVEIFLDQSFVEVSQ